MHSVMEKHHPLLKELLDVSATYQVELAKAFTTFEIYQELSVAQKLSDLKYGFSENLKMFYLSGKPEVANEIENIYIPAMYTNEITPLEMNKIQEVLSPLQKRFCLIIRDGDSSSACYCIKKGLVKPDSPDTCKRKKEIEDRKSYFDKSIQGKRKLLYMKALNKERKS